MSQLENKKTPLDLRTERHKMVVADLLGPAGDEDFKSGHAFHKTALSGVVRFTVSESARQKVLSRLLRLNHERWEEEQKMNDEGGGMKKEKKVKKAKSKSAGDGQMGLL